MLFPEEIKPFPLLVVIYMRQKNIKMLILNQPKIFLTMKRLLITLVLIASLGMLHQHARASHIAALDLSLTCIGGNDYIVKFVLYRDCSGINAPSTVKLPLPVAVIRPITSR